MESGGKDKVLTVPLPRAGLKEFRPRIEISSLFRYYFLGHLLFVGRFFWSRGMISSRS
jgi:hypothetical protein